MEDNKISLTKQVSASSEDDRFDQIMAQIGFNGKFQRWFNIIFNFWLVLLVCLPTMNILLALAVPDHWCHVPGRNLTNFTHQEWKDLMLPKEFDTKGIESTSKCKMYNISLENLSPEEFDPSQHSIIDCQHGWEFDQTWYTETAVSEGGWVCEKELFVSNAFAFGRIGDVVGTCIFGQLGDTIGRRPVFFITLSILIFARILSSFTANNFSLFAFATLVGSLPSTAVFQSPLIVSMEISDENQRSNMAMLQCLAWTLGMCIMPLMLWMQGHWFDFMLTTTAPCILFLFSSSWMIESPRWLANQGKTKRCIVELEHIARINGTKVPEDAMIMLSKYKNQKKEKAYGIVSLFANWRLARNTILLLVSWVNESLIYYVIILTISTMEGNPFMNFFWQGLVEFPAYVIARYSCDKFGRRWTKVFFFTMTTLCCIIMAFLITKQGMEIPLMILSSIMKFCLSFVFYATNLQSLELYPTCVRQSGLSLMMISCSAFGIFGPYIVYLGTSFNACYPAIVLTVLSFTGTLASCFIPETQYEKLPETLAEAQQFGKNQKFWSWPLKTVHQPEKI